MSESLPQSNSQLTSEQFATVVDESVRAHVGDYSFNAAAQIFNLDLTGIWDQDAFVKFLHERLQGAGIPTEIDGIKQALSIVLQDDGKKLGTFTAELGFRLGCVSADAPTR